MFCIKINVQNPSFIISINSGAKLICYLFIIDNKVVFGINHIVQIWWTF